MPGRVQKVTAKKTLYHVYTAGKGKTPRTTFKGAFATKQDAMVIAEGYRERNPTRRVGVFRSTRIKMWAPRPRRRGRLIRG